ncbi:hypothetical protein [Nibricoccus sp. IMCC34717]|uniref:hypothetical protein n=1 Tax=Nibricoccus sp. IMCC34717 TaxID=3034021 RepID=UPI00384FB92A
MKTTLLSTALGVALASQAFSAGVVLTGDYLKVGVSDSGLLSYSGTGLKFDPAGTGTFGAADFLPASGFEFVSWGYAGQVDRFSTTSGSLTNGTTVDLSSGSLLKAKTTGVFYDRTIGLEQVLSFDKTGKTIHFDVTIKNLATWSPSQIAYARGLNPEQDVSFGGSSSTQNSISGDETSVSALGSTSDWKIDFYAPAGFTQEPSIRSTWTNLSPYFLLGAANDGNGNNTLNRAWMLGTIASGQSASFSYEYRISGPAPEPKPTPPPRTGVPDAASTVGLLGAAVGLLALVRRRAA